ncbi:hypothetical protein CVT24_011471 [Panaeolus cyanescens]|uniref:CBM1 domain-containing protein n=1 Tax=Panaeolus cyanescens TaxID=181874 RepID=A0A409YGS6_9AGAR|nr:hypothetical protein CVT24_011471 [Panaeolus cyanescens]
MIFKSSSVLVILVAASAGVASPTTNPQPEEVVLGKRVWLSSVDVQAACDQQYGSGYTASAVDSSCGGWKCKHNVTQGQYPVNLQSYCVNRHPGRPGVYASCSGGVYNWQCHDNT